MWNVSVSVHLRGMGTMEKLLVSKRGRSSLNSNKSTCIATGGYLPCPKKKSVHPFRNWSDLNSTIQLNVDPSPWSLQTIQGRFAWLFLAILPYSYHYLMHIPTVSYSVLTRCQTPREPRRWIFKSFPTKRRNDGDTTFAGLLLPWHCIDAMPHGSKTTGPKNIRRWRGRAKTMGRRDQEGR